MFVMGHRVTAVIAKSRLLASFAITHALRAPIALAVGLAILPLRDEDLDAILKPPLLGIPRGFSYLAAQLVEKFQAASIGGAVMYFETAYHGGTGTQGAIVFRYGKIVFGPKSAEFGPINEALALLGVGVLAPARDEFETVGLDRYRRSDDWLDSVTSS
jgi:hypothetical protein